jgi:hypothetical protein
MTMRENIKRLIRVAGVPFVLSDYFLFKKADKDKRFSLLIRDFYPQIKDKTGSTHFDRHYIYHTAWAARAVASIRPRVHTDISSSLYFCSIVSAFIPVRFYDYRPAELGLPQLESGRCDLTKLQFVDNSIDSLSCMHTVEHVGLGRYGDPIDPEGDIKAMNELMRVTAKGGSLLFVVPIGDKAIIEYNAHRIYTYNQIISYFKGMTLREFSLIPEFAEKGGLIENAVPEMIKGERYSCGCFWFIK